YTYNSGYNSAYWDANYPNSIKNMLEVIEHTKSDATKVNLYNIARIFKAFISGITTPTYDKQQDIHTDLLNELQDAAGKLNASAENSVGSADLPYAGNVAKWKKFAYSEMLRLAMRMSKVDANNAKTWALKAVQG